MYRVKDSASVRDLSYSKLRDREVILEVVVCRGRVRAEFAAKIIGAVWWHGRLLELDLESSQKSAAVSFTGVLAQEPAS